MVPNPVWPEKRKFGQRGSRETHVCALREEHMREGPGRSSVQFSSVAQPCLTLWDPTDCSMPGLPVLHQLPELAQTHVYRVSDAIQPSHPLSSPSPTLNLSQHQGLFQWVSSSNQVPKYWSFSFSISPSNEYSGLIPFRMDWFHLFLAQGTLKSLLQHHSSVRVKPTLPRPWPWPSKPNSQKWRAHHCGGAQLPGNRVRDYIDMWKVNVLVNQLYPTLCDLMDCSPPGSSIHGILQARGLEWVGIPFCRSSQPRDRTQVSCIAEIFCINWTTREVHIDIYICLSMYSHMQTHIYLYRPV